ncbi:hypothetical protein INS49_007075 [Diaporthe citri]|uniref:uncharacterized protein n=1 Tax=Diaporthe citri TaxID=83186 RepID=UPI001C8208AC|nr:uncharacterized protein INS49_007075 [Diaporthe citri]KAG6365464.1 hypothetical protein INS49_007075 [Diaporthe citri]
MSDPVNLAGVIGTWVAVFLALVALLGLLPAYLLYKRSRSENAAAIAAIDDPRRTFVSGIHVFGVVLAQKFKIPDLRRAPPLSALETATLDNIPSERLLGPTKSGTAWIEFAQLITTVFPGFELGGKSLLSFEHGEARLPVHKTWLIALGILHRYSLRLDHGLPLGATVDAAADGGLVQGARLSGLSGYLDYREVPSSVYRFEGNYEISFEMHRLPTLRDALMRDRLSFLSLALLFRGYVIRDQGVLLKGRIASWVSRSRSGQVQQVIVRVKQKELHENFLRVLPGINAQAQREFNLEIGPVPKHIRKDAQPGELTASVWRRHGYCRLGYWQKQREDFEIWILKKDAYYFVLGYLEQELSPYGFLFDTQQDLVVRRMMKTNTVATLLDLATRWWQKLPEEVLTDALRTKIQTGLEELSHDDLLAVQWSRRVMQAIVSLDDAFSAIAQHESRKAGSRGIMWKSIRAMYACDEDFQQSMEQYLNGLPLEVGEDSQASISFHVGGGTINVPVGDGAQFPFDFDHLFPDTMKSQEPSGGVTSIAPAIVVLACLQGQLRAVAWKMSFSPGPLKKLDNKIRDICYVSMHKFHWSSSRSPSRRRRSGSSGSWRTHDVRTEAERRPSWDSSRHVSVRSVSISSPRSVDTTQSGHLETQSRESGSEG